jgi:O-antigen biosynthesis protein
VIPVFRNLAATRKCLDSVIAPGLPDNCGIVIIEDGSPEPDVVEYCQLMSRRESVVLLRNERNLGFVASCNRAFSAFPDSDVILLNSDTEVAGDWIRRLNAAAYREDDIGTVTPFSNNATICSYPAFNTDNPLPTLWDTAQLDALFREANREQFADIPTAVGFCMYIRRDCLDATGPFDQDNFGPGYGEECDFSMRAAAIGWRNVIAADVFVYHAGSASFGPQGESRKGMADDTMRRLHPDYGDLVSRFLEQDPLAPFRAAVDRLRLETRPEDGVNLLSESFERQQALKEKLSSLDRLRRGQEKQLATALEHVAWLDKQHKEQYQLARYSEKKLTEVSGQYDELNGNYQRLEHAHLGLQQERETLSRLLEECRETFRQTDEALAEAQAGLQKASGELQMIKQSRSWRYTAWLRRFKGGL